jgi:choline kinase
MKAIILAAGSGTRISKNFPALPKALIQVNNISIISRQISLFKKNGIDEIIVITGPFKEKFSMPDITCVYDQKFEEHDILGSLMEAREHIFGDVIITYSDIIFEDLILKKILQTNLDIGIAVDLDWKKAYENRKSHAISEAENILFDNSRNILEIRKNIRNSNLEIGEFLGIIKLSNNGCKLLLKRYDEIRNDKCGRFYDTKSLTKAYLTDMIQKLIESKIEVKPILISGKWCEIDTIEDLKRAENMF